MDNLFLAFEDELEKISGRVPRRFLKDRLRLRGRPFESGGEARARPGDRARRRPRARDAAGAHDRLLLLLADRHAAHVSEPRAARAAAVARSDGAHQGA